MNKFRISVLDAVTDALIIHSSIDRRQHLTSKTDEMCIIGQDDVCVLKNYADRPAELRLTSESEECGRTIFRPSRQSTFTLHSRRDIDLTLGAGESVVIRTERAKDPISSPPGSRGGSLA